jgi:hypothetical protein
MMRAKGMQACQLGESILAYQAGENHFAARGKDSCLRLPRDFWVSISFDIATERSFINESMNGSGDNLVNQAAT